MADDRWCIVYRVTKVWRDGDWHPHWTFDKVREDRVGTLPPDEQWRVAFRDSDVLDDPAVGRVMPAPPLPDPYPPDQPSEDGA